VKCEADPYCGGFNGRTGKNAIGEHSVHHMKYASCAASAMENYEEGMYLFVLRDRPQPPPPPPQIPFPVNCTLFEQTSHCYEPTIGYKQIAINMSAPRKENNYNRESRYNCLNACCEACAADAPRCKQWFVPHPKNASSIPRGMTTCILVDHKPTDPIQHFNPKTNMTVFPFCIGAQPPPWTPPKQCHNRFKPLSLYEAVNWTATQANAGKPVPPSPGHKHHWPPTPTGKPTRKVLHGKTLGECCDACYLDVQGGEQKMCTAWCVQYSPYSTFHHVAWPCAGGSSSRTSQAQTQADVVLCACALLCADGASAHARVLAAGRCLATPRTTPATSTAGTIFSTHTSGTRKATTPAVAHGGSLCRRLRRHRHQPPAAARSR
jgi:hypothetical protein